MDWEEYKEAFEVDGSWRDIYVLDTDISHWQLFLDDVRSGTHKTTFHLQGNWNESELSALDIFGSEPDLKPMPFLEIEVGTVSFNCHFFCEAEIEFDMDPRQVRGETEAEMVFAFMRQIGQLLGKAVILTPENMSESPIFKFDVDDRQIRFIPANSSV